ncbi:MAG: serine/threonine-protein kinase [Pyrinomonadaceae bacterium]
MNGVPHLIAGRYRLECEVGRGGMGTVYRATHIGLERSVAVKILKPEFAADSEVVGRFMREARTMALLHHSSAAAIFDAGRLPDGRPFIVMEFVEGTTLAETLAREGRFQAQRAVEIASTVCDVLAAAHSLGIVHRDLQAFNIMLSARGECACSTLASPKCWPLQRMRRELMRPLIRV